MSINTFVIVICLPLIKRISIVGKEYWRTRKMYEEHSDLFSPFVSKIKILAHGRNEVNLLRWDNCDCNLSSIIH